MQARYEMIIKFEVVQEIDTLEGLKTNTEYANDVGQMVIDECTNINAVGGYEVLNSSVKITPRYCSIWQGCPEERKECCHDCERSIDCTIPYYCDCSPNSCNCLTYEKPD